MERHNRRFAELVPPGSLVLDAGAGDQIYRPIFSHAVYETADFEKVDKHYAQSTYVCDLSTIPVEDGRFDFVVCNQVLEHLPEPLAVLKELCRVLKPGGQAIFTMPLFFEEHEQPYDFFRYTQFAHRKLFPEAGFDVLSIDWMEGYLGTVAYQLESAAFNLPMKPRDIAPGVIGFLAAPLLVALKLSFFGLAAIFSRLDMRHVFKERGYPKNYVVIVRKGGSGARQPDSCTGHEQP